jgi:hypothetical protein
MLVSPSQYDCIARRFLSKRERFSKAMGQVRLASMRPRVSRSTSLAPPTPAVETPVCLRRQCNHGTVQTLQSRLQWPCHMLSAASHAPFLRWCRGVASPRTPQEVAHTMIEACTCLPCFDSLMCLCPCPQSAHSLSEAPSLWCPLNHGWCGQRGRPALCTVHTASAPCRRGVPRPW